MGVVNRSGSGRERSRGARIRIELAKKEDVGGCTIGHLGMESESLGRREFSVLALYSSRIFAGTRLARLTIQMASLR